MQLASASTVERKRCIDVLTLLVENAPQCLHELLSPEIVSHTVAALIDGRLPDVAKEQAARALLLMSLAGDASVQGRICCATAVSAITACMHAEGSTAKCRTYCAQAMYALAAHASSLPVLVAAEAPMHLEQTLATAVEASEVHSAAVSALGMLTRHAIEGGDAAAMAAVLEHNTPAGKREVLKALRRIAEGGERAAELVAAGVVRLLVEVVRTTDGQWEVGGAGEDAICTLAKLAAVEACRAELAEGDVISVLISALRSGKAATGLKEAVIALLHKIICAPSFVPSRLGAEDFMLFLTLTRMATDLSTLTQEMLGDITERLVEFFAPSLINSIEMLLELVSWLGDEPYGWACGAADGPGTGRNVLACTHAGACDVWACLQRVVCGLRRVSFSTLVWTIGRTVELAGCGSCRCSAE